eukprot:gene26352-biopygen16047
MSRGGGFATGIELESKLPIPREAQDWQLRFQLDSGREHPPRAMSSSRNRCKVTHFQMATIYL